MNHLREAKNQFQIICDGGVSIPSRVELMKAHALIAIAEQLEIINKSKSEIAVEAYDSGQNDAFAEMGDE